MTISETAMAFFDACETGKGWEVCKKYCQDGAPLSCQADALADIATVEGYTGWTAGILTPIPDGHYDLKSFATDHERSIVTATAVFRGTQTGEAARYRRPAARLPPTTLMSWNSKATRSRG